MSEKEVKELRVGRWSSEEDDLLRRLIGEYGEAKWKAVSKGMGTRTGIQCLHRWTKVLKPGIIKGAWRPDEDKVIVDWVSENGPISWCHCAKLIPGRCGKQCRERWYNGLADGLKKDDWSLAEEAILETEYKNLGPKWSAIAAKLPGRSENSIKNRFYSMKRRSNRVRFTNFSGDSGLFVKKDLSDLISTVISKIALADERLEEAKVAINSLDFFKAETNE